MLIAGVYSYLPLGFKALSYIEEIIRQEMNACGACEVLLPALQPLELWQKSGRDKEIGDVMLKVTDRKGRSLSLGPTHEEVVTDLIKNHISSYRQLPLVLYQIQTKFRDELRPRFGLVRGCEFIMKDAYSFDIDEAGLDKNYKALYEAYNRIFKRCGLEVLSTEADPGVMGGNFSHEFMAPAPEGEDSLLFCPNCKATKPSSSLTTEAKAGRRIAKKEGEKYNCVKCKGKLDRINCIELAHIFKLGEKYSKIFGANFLDANGSRKAIIMGCYGIGVSRLISAIVAQNHDLAGILWPKEVTPYKIMIMPLDVNDKNIMERALDIYKELEKNALEALFDDRDERAGVKFKDADLLGIPLQVIIGKVSLKGDKIELKVRRTQEKIVKPKSEILNTISEFYR